MERKDCIVVLQAYFSATSKTRSLSGVTTCIISLTLSLTFILALNQTELFIPLRITAFNDFKIFSRQRDYTSNFVQVDKIALSNHTSLIKSDFIHTAFKEKQIKLSSLMILCITVISIQYSMNIKIKTKNIRWNKE